MGLKSKLFRGDKKLEAAASRSTTPGALSAKIDELWFCRKL